MSFVEDLNIFLAGEFSDRARLAASRFGSEASHPKADATNGEEISGIFDERYEAIFEQYSSTASGRVITFLISSADAHGLNKSDRLTIKGKDYLIVALEPTHDGKLTKLVLKNG